MRTCLLVLLIGVLPGVSAQTNDHWLDSLEAYWGRINAKYRDPEHSPLPKEHRAHFVTLERYAADSSYRVRAIFRPKEGKAFGMKTTTERLPEYQAVGKLHFKLKGVKEELTVYRNIALSEQPDYVNYLFIPFTDLTNGESTYGGGRYVEMEGPLGKQVELDFNRAYNPYCAYGGRYSCPIPPAENHLGVAVHAGVKAFAH